MPSIVEAAASGSQLNAALRTGIESIARDQVITFNQYQRTVLPLDGYIFWVSTGVSQSVRGSLHYATDLRQAEDETAGVNRVVFTAESEVQPFNQLTPSTLWIGAYDSIEFAFSSRGLFYGPANIFHYVGIAVYPALKSQIIATASDLPTEPIVTNSLPIWLALNQYATVYPSFLVGENIEPPYIACHIDPGSTLPMQDFPVFNQGIVTNPSPPPDILIGTEEPNTGASPLYQQPSSQLVRERVRLTLYGFTNQTAIQFMVYVNEQSLATGNFGVLNVPVIRDEKRTQPELAVIAQKKTLEYEIDYYQSTADAIARRLILQAALSLTLSKTPT